MCFWGESITEVQSEGVAVNPPLKNLLLELNVARQGLMDYSTHTKSIIFFKYILQKAILCYGYIYKEKTNENKVFIQDLYLHTTLKTVWEIIVPNQPCGSYLTMPVVSGSSTDCTGEAVPSKTQFWFSWVWFS